MCIWTIPRCKTNRYLNVHVYVNISLFCLSRQPQEVHCIPFSACQDGPIHRLGYVTMSGRDKGLLGRLSENHKFHLQTVRSIWDTAS